MLERQLFPKNLNSFQKNKSIWANCYFALNFLQPKWIIPIIEYVYFFNLRALYNSEFLPAVPAHPPLRAGCWGDALGWSLRSLPACLIARATEVGLYWWLSAMEQTGWKQRRSRHSVSSSGAVFWHQCPEMCPLLESCFFIYVTPCDGSLSWNFL